MLTWLSQTGTERTALPSLPLPLPWGRSVDAGRAMCNRTTKAARGLSPSGSRKSGVLAEAEGQGGRGWWSGGGSCGGPRGRESRKERNGHVGWLARAACPLVLRKKFPELSLLQSPAWAGFPGNMPLTCVAGGLASSSSWACFVGPGPFNSASRR